MKRIKQFNQFQIKEGFDPFGIQKRRRAGRREEELKYSNLKDQNQIKYEIKLKNLEEQVPLDVKKLMKKIVNKKLEIINCLPATRSSSIDSEIYKFILSDKTKIEIMRSSADQYPSHEVDIHDCFIKINNSEYVNISPRMYFDMKKAVKEFFVDNFNINAMNDHGDGD